MDYYPDPAPSTGHRAAIPDANSILKRARFSAAKVLILSLTVPHAFLLLDSAFPRHWSLIPVTDCPLYVSVHSKRASPPPKSHFRC